MTLVSIEPFNPFSVPALQSEGNTPANRLLVADEQQQDSAARQVLRAGQLRRWVLRT